MSERYHAITLAAVLLALAAGMIIGASFLQNPILNATRNQISALKDRADRLKADNLAAAVKLSEEQERVRKESALFSPMIERLLKGQLQDRSVLIIQTGSYPEAAADAAQSLRTAGATILGTVAIDSSKLSDESQTALIQQLSNWSSGLSAATLSALNGVTVTSESENIPSVKFIVLVGGRRKTSDDNPPSFSLDLSLIQTLRKIDELKVVGAETNRAEISSVPVYTQSGIPSVDCIDLPPGMICLPYLFKQENGAFGLKKTAEEVMPNEVVQKL